MKQLGEENLWVEAELRANELELRISVLDYSYCNACASMITLVVLASIKHLGKV